MNETTRTHGASCTCPPCMERSDRAFTVWYDDAPDVDLPDEEYRDPWAFIRAVAHGWPLPTAPEFVHLAYGESLRLVAQRMLEVRERDSQPTEREPTWRPSTPATLSEPSLWQHRPPTCQRCGAAMLLPRSADDGWTWGAFGWRHECAKQCKRCGCTLHADRDGEIAEGTCQSCMWDEECELMSGKGSER